MKRRTLLKLLLVLNDCRYRLDEVDAEIRQIRDSQRLICRQMIPVIGLKNVFSVP
jgi:hypothetical protein